MSAVSEDEVAAQDLEFDMWQGQFEFVGNQYRDGNEEESELSYNGHGTYDESIDLFRPSAIRPRRNGFKKTEVQMWCDDLSGHVSSRHESPLQFSDFIHNSFINLCCE